MAKGLGHKAIDAIEEGGMSVEEAATLAAFTDPNTLSEACDIAWSTAAEFVDGWIDGIDEPDNAVVAHQLRQAAHLFTVAAVLHEALAIERSDGEETK